MCSKEMEPRKCSIRRLDEITNLPRDLVMTCIHLQQLYNLCKENGLKLGSSDLVRVVCEKCDEKEVCPSQLMDEYDYQQERDAKKSETANDATK